MNATERPHQLVLDRIALLLILLIAAGAFVSRGYLLELRPFHHDEGVQAVKAGELYDTGHYGYQPAEFHGPTLYYFTLPILKLSGARNFADASDTTFRTVPVLFGVGVILLLRLLRRDLGVVATVTAAVLLATSPAMVFYSRYYIQEMLLVFFAALALAAMWWFYQSSRPVWAVALGLALGLMYATKETSVIYGAALGVAGGCLILRRRLHPGQPLWQMSRRRLWMLLLTGATATAVAILFYSSFLDHPRGPLDSVLAFGHYLERSGGAGSAADHQEPWYYYLKMLCFTKDAPGPWWSEGLILALAAIGFCVAIPAALSKRSWLPAAINPELAMFIAIYTLCLTVAFSAIPYKTPWNLLGFLHGFILLAGIGASAVFHRLPWIGARIGWLVLLLAGCWQLASQAARANLRFCSDPRNPYVYAHSGPDVVRLARRIGEIAALHPDGTAMRVHFITPDYWPMPYYLRKFNRVGYWNELPPHPDAPVIVVNSALQERLTPLLADHYHTAFYGLRPGVLLVLNIRQDLWDRYLALQREKSDKK